MKLRGRKQKKELAAAIERGRRLLVAGQHQENFEFLEEAVRRFPDDPEIRLLYAMTLLEFRPNDVASQASIAIDLAADNPQILVSAAQLMFNRGEVEAARSCATRVSDLAQADFVLMSSLINLNGLLAAYDEEYDAAEEELRSAVEDDPRSGSFAVDLAQLLASRGRSVEAIEVIDEALTRTDKKGTLERVRSEISHSAGPE